jgi:hypothetical protein|tara:strand:+ start:2958 stop:3521 length:564 start_codon:yes stop_codon:yes gene_type:complete
MNEIINAIKSIISPEQSWSAFVMKITGLIVVSIIAYIGFQQYRNLNVEEDTEIPIVEVFENDPEKVIKVEDLITRLLRSERSIESIWLYDWVDARNVVPLITEPRNSADLLPTGYWMEGDEYVIGNFVLSQCTSLERNVPNIACPIMSSEDAWGVLLVTYQNGTSPNLKTVKATAMKISEVLYLITR